VMPVFFLVGGFAAGVSWRRAGNDAGHAARWLRRRALRLLIPTTWYVAAALVATTAAARAGVSAKTLDLAGWAVALHLWFLPVYLILTLLTPVSYAAHRRWGTAVPAAMALAAAAIDVLVITAHVRALGWLNYVLVWGAAYQLGFAWQDGTLARTPRRTWLIAAGGAAVFVALEWSGLFPVSLIGMEGQRINNTAPPSIALEAYAAAQLSTLIAIAPSVSRRLKRPLPRRLVEVCNSEVMTVYLWHMLPVVVAGVLLYPSGALSQPAAGTAQWWILRPLWMAILALLLVPLVLASRRLRRPRARPAPSSRPSPTSSPTPSPAPHPALNPAPTSALSPAPNPALNPAPAELIAAPRKAAGGYSPLLYAAIALTSFALARFAIAGFAPDGRLPVGAATAYTAGVLLMAADTLFIRRQRVSPESSTA
ncbi:MAG TPA: acyltransferase family protein, partial [Actinocrinis sp.]|uniref:acyltransferase family protein n=1 Tax=Actinocrinis sp. TaxID=1920516 RepID=UPI002DDD5E91